MAARRFLRSKIDWAAFSERIPAKERSNFQLFKAKSDGYMKRVMSNPENPPNINWAFYRSQLQTPALVDEFEKQYQSVKVQYPIDNLTSAVNAQEKEVDKLIQEHKEESDLACEYYKKKLDWYENMLPFEEMTYDDYRDYFPNKCFDPINRPTMWPHDEPNREVFPWRDTSHH